MNIVDIIGIVGALLFFIKLGIHIFIKRKVDKKFGYGSLGHFTNPVLFFPITDDVTGYLKSVKKVSNFTYIIALVLIVIFVIGINMQGKNDHH